MTTLIQRILNRIAEAETDGDKLTVKHLQKTLKFLCEETAPGVRRGDIQYRERRY